MMRTLFSGILGLRVHQSEMDVIGNNVANVNTFGFKRGRVVFQDILSQTENFSTKPTDTRGGINATQIGLGVRLSSVDNVFTQGAFQATGRANDIAIEGDGFFVVKDGDRKLYTRAGTLDVDADANLIHAGTGFKLQGYSARLDQNTRDLYVDKTSIGDLNLKEVEKLFARATSEIEYRSNLKATAEERSLPFERVMTFKDDVGNEQQVTFRFIKIDKNNWNWIALDDTEGQVGNGVLTFDDNGRITSSTGGPLLAFDPDGATGSPPKLTLQENNTAAITNATFRPLIAETWSMTHPFSVNGLPASTDRILLNQLYDTSTLPARPDPDSPQFDLRNISDNRSIKIVISGTDGNGDTVQDVDFIVTSRSTIGDLVTAIDKAFPNAIASFNPNTGKIELKDASPGIKHASTFKLQYVDSTPGLSSFPGLVTTGAPDISAAGGTSRLVAASGTVADGVHSITIKRVDATPAQVKGETVGLTRFTTFAELNIGKVDEFTIAIDKNAPQKIVGLRPGLPAVYEPQSKVIDPPAGGYGTGNVVINGYQTTWQAAEVAGMTKTQFGTFVAQRITNDFDTVVNSDPGAAVYAYYDTAKEKIILQHRTPGAQNKIKVNSTSPNANNPTGFNKDEPAAFGTDGSTIGDLIDAVNNQVPGAKMEFEGDRVVIKRSVTGADFNIIVSDVNGLTGGGYVDPNTPPSLSEYSIARQVLGSYQPSTVVGTDQTYTLIDLFTSPDKTIGNVQLTYNDFKPGQTIGNDQIGYIIIESTGFQPGTATIYTTTEKDAREARVAIPTVNAYSADFTLQTGGTPITDVKVAMIPGDKHVTSTTVYDSLGNPHVVNMTFEKVDANKWQYAVSLDPEDPIILDYFATHPVEGDAPTDLELAFANDGKIGNRRGLLIFNEFGKVDVNKTSSVNAVNLPDLVKPITFKPADAKEVSFMPDFRGVTQFDAGYSTAARSQNGYAMGMLQGFEITNSGVIVGSYTNGYKRDIGQVVIANFTNAAGLEKRSDSMFAQSSNSGEPLVGEPGSGGRGVIQSQTLEMANVDLAREFTDMIVAQRGFQANARTITTADQILQELINLKR